MSRRPRFDPVALLCWLALAAATAGMAYAAVRPVWTVAGWIR